MPRINLLPWREEERKERKIAFGVALGVSALAAAVVTFGVYLMFGSMIDAQEARNEKLRGEIKKLDRQQALVFRPSRPNSDSGCRRYGRLVAPYSSLMLLSLTILRHFSRSAFRARSNSASVLPTGSKPIS